MRMTSVLWLAWACAGCSATPGEVHHEKPAQVEHAVAEADLPVVHLSAAAMKRLAIRTSQVEDTLLSGERLVGGEVIVPPGRGVSVAAPMGGLVRAASETALTPGARVRQGQVLLRLFPLAPIDRDLRARSEREVSATRAQLEQADARVLRLTQLNAEHASSQRLYEEAVTAREVARADVHAAETRARNTAEAPLVTDVAWPVRAPTDGVVRSVAAAPGQAVAAGAPLFEVVAVDALQVRVPIYAGDLGRIDFGAVARVQPLARDGDAVDAAPVAGPPTADPTAATVDRYFTLAGEARFVPGERVLVHLTMQRVASARSVPTSSLVRDADGAAWVYACAGEGAFRRERIDPMRVSGQRLVFTRGPALGTCVASVGAMEIFGSEFEPGH